MYSEDEEEAEPPKERTKINFNVEGKISLFFQLYNQRKTLGRSNNFRMNFN